jgi:hypothetical protein
VDATIQIVDFPIDVALPRRQRHAIV